MTLWGDVRLSRKRLRGRTLRIASHIGTTEITPVLEFLLFTKILLCLAVASLLA